MLNVLNKLSFNVYLYKSLPFSRDANDQLPIHIATSKGIRNNIELLLREDPDVVDEVDNSDQSPILLAAKNGFPNVVSYLLAKNANYKMKDKYGLTAFDWAVKRSLPDVVQVFLNMDGWKEVNIDGKLAYLLD